MPIEQLGFDSWFRQRLDDDRLAGHTIARITAVNRNNYLVNGGEGDVPGEMTGKLRFSADSPLDHPAVGDWIYAQFINQGTMAIIAGVLPRRTLLKRKTPGRRVEFQLIAANIDTALIIQGLGSDYNIRRLERYLAMAHESRIHPVALLSKSDLLSAEQIEKKRAAIRALMPEVEILAFSNTDGTGLEPVRSLFVPGKTYCMLGSSGVGKTTLLHHLIGQEMFRTRKVREKDGKGRHTTSRRQLIVLENGAMIIDTPGMRELGNMDITEGLEDTFQEITRLADGCRYGDCTHVHEEGCAVRAAVQKGLILQERYRNYVKMVKESAHYERSYVERRRRDKQFGKFIKSTKKQIKKIKKNR
jgi:ribosome biogenesis GTPase